MLIKNLCPTILGMTHELYCALAIACIKARSDKRVDALNRRQVDLLQVFICAYYSI